MSSLSFPKKRLVSFLNPHNFNELGGFAKIAVILVVFLMLTNCSGGGGGDSAPAEDNPDPSPQVVGLEISPAVISVVAGTEVAAIATAIFSDNTKKDVTQEVSWEVESELVASVGNLADNKGIVVGNTEGNTSLIARLGNISSTNSVVVSTADLVNMTVTPNNSQLPNGTRLSLHVTGYYSNNASQDLTASVSWASNDENIITVDQNGVVEAVGIGSANVVASHAGLSASAVITVINATLTDIEILPADISLAVGTELELSAVGHFSDGTARDISHLVSGQSMNEQVARFNDQQQLVLSAVATGNTAINISLNGISKQAGVSVSDAILQTLTVETNYNTLAVGSSLSISAIATFSDNSTQDLTEQVTWSSSDDSVLVVSNALEQAGRITAMSPGIVEVSAAAQGSTAIAKFTVSDAQLLSINLTPINPSIAAGSQIQLSAVGNFSDGSSMDVTEQVAWKSTDANVADVAGSGEFAGLISAANAGVATITATIASVVGSSRVTVTNTLLQEIEINPLQLSIANGTFAQLQVLGRYADNSTQDLTNQVTWASSNTDVAVVSNVSASYGVVQALSIGQSTISAQLTDDASMQAEAVITVSDATLETIVIEPGNAQITNNSTIQFTATGEFSDGSTQDLTGIVTWYSSDTRLVVINNGSDNKGLATGVISSFGDSGNISISAKLASGNNTIEASEILTVEYAPDRPVSIIAYAAPNVILNNGQDATTINISVKAASADAVVPDTTAVDVEITDGSGTLSASSVMTTNGEAQVSLTSGVEGFVVITTTVRGTGISNQTVVYSVASFASVFGEIAIAQANINGTTVLAGSRFIYFIFNFSNRDFDIYEFNFYVENTLRRQDPTPVAMPGGSVYGGGILFDENISAAFFTLQFMLNEPATMENFPLNAVFSLQ